MGKILGSVHLKGHLQEGFFVIQSVMQSLQKTFPQDWHSKGSRATIEQIRQSKLSLGKFTKRYWSYP